MAANNFIVTPWEVEGKVDYNKLIEKFGTHKITQEIKDKIKKLTGELHVMLRRDIFFSHRDLDLVLSDYENGKGFFTYTGRGPSGPMHIGHILPFYFTKWIQEKFDVNVYIEITDDEKFWVKKKLSYKDAQKWSYENILDIIAVGFNPDKTFIFQDTEYISNIYPMAVKVARKINFSLAKAVFGFTDQSNIGIIFFPALQIIPTFFERKRCLIPSAIDQDPYWRIQRDIAESFGYYKTAAIHSKFLPALTGPTQKMSASKPETAIYLNDDEKIVRKKIFRYAFSGGQPTIEMHRKLGGNPDIDVSFIWLKYFFEPDDKKLKEIEEKYRAGELLTGELKQILIEKINNFLKEHKRRRKKAIDLIDKFKYDGSLASEMWSKKIS
ncbi:MAG: tryptophan--tRNA ligase [Thermoproteales archaeon]|nr:tryptophan--tRNA ligase [Thermoproteales archaeon]